MSSTHPLILASKSPRRQELLRKAGFVFDVFTQDFPEDFPDGHPPQEVAEFLAIQKNTAYREILKSQTVITADTTVILNDLVLNKPENNQEALEMLQHLSGTTHQVVCGVCISSPTKSHHFSETTEVTFLPLTTSEIQYYIDHFHPFDKAGAYGIQEWIGLNRISSIKGSYYNVMGLPVHRVYEVLTKDFNIQVSQ